MQEEDNHGSYVAKIEKKLRPSAWTDPLLEQKHQELRGRFGLDTLYSSGNFLNSYSTYRRDNYSYLLRIFFK